MSSIVRSRATRSAIQVPYEPDSLGWINLSAFLQDPWRQTYTPNHETNKKEYGVEVNGLRARPGDWIVSVDSGYSVLSPTEFQRMFEVVGTRPDTYPPVGGES